MVAMRRGHTRALTRARRRLQRLSVAQQSALARAYTVYLELVNVCENAYRTHRLRHRRREGRNDGSGSPTANVVFVLTAHPTESRSPVNIALMRRIQGLLVAALDRNGPPDPERLAHLLHLVWETGTHPAHKPTVEDEAAHLFGLLDDPILEELLRLRRDGHVVRLRTWVGGDKDGHPGVGPEQTERSLSLSRSRLLELCEHRLLPEVGSDVRLLSDRRLDKAWRTVVDQIDDLRSVTIGDGRRVSRLQRDVTRLTTVYARRCGRSHPRLDDLRLLLEHFPGLVVPLELREERGAFQRAGALADMLVFLRDVARGGEVDWYVRGCVVSMVERAEDLWAADRLVRDVLGRPAIPIVPLFELPAVLQRSVDVLDQAMADPGFSRGVRSRATGLEVMLGYSDTSKRVGVLASRLQISETMAAIGAWAERERLRVIFFHGSGGSVGRGGGSIADRAASWPASALEVVKQTLQGEMVERTLATPEILRSQIVQIARVQAAPPRRRKASLAARDLARRSQQAYVELVGAPGFVDLLRMATPYARLGALNIGSRPVKRGGQEDTGLDRLRAIPWVLCWTQTRYLLHAWAGIGTAWREVRADASARARLLRALDRDPMLRSYLRLLQFTLAKTEPTIWREYVRMAGVSKRLPARLEREWQDAVDLARQVTADGELLSDRGWLRESIYYRAPMIHPLNLIQIEALSHPKLTAAQERVFRETVTGIAAGMLTTG